jgi:aryl-alcohol dehydrogenase-like predicted oxidoreductase
MTNLILGTAQFGAGYGVTNSTGRLSDETVSDILVVAAAANIDLFDTAPDYGDAQSRLGALRPGGTAPRYVSKFGLPSGPFDASTLLNATLTALDVPSLYGILFHRVADLRDERATGAWSALRGARQDGLVTRIGASIYDVDDLAVVVERFPDLDLIQVPANIVDRRLLDAPMLRELSHRGVEIHVRSAYLQGLLLASPSDVPDQLAGLRPAIAELGVASEAAGLSVLEIALGFLKNHELVDAVLVGALSATELRATTEAWNRIDDDIPIVRIPTVDERLLDPRKWPPREGA